MDWTHLLDNEHIYEASLNQSAENELTGMRRTRGWTDNQYIYFAAQFSKPFQAVKLGKDGRIAVLSFDTADGQPVVAKVGISTVSVDNARQNLEAEVKDFDFDAVRAAARNQWEQALDVIHVEGGTEAELTNFYTALYHSLVVPNTVSDVNGQYRRHNMEIGQLPEGQVRYNTFSLWDTFRAWNPLMTLTDTTLVNAMVNSFLDIYDASGELPIWSLSAGETGTMIGYHSVSVIADAYLKGIRGFDAAKALEAMAVSAEKNEKGADYYVKNGFIPANIKKESISCLLEFAYDDWCIAQMAKAMGRDDVYATFIERSQNYINVFDGSTRFFRPKREDGNWETPFNPVEVGRAYTEATAWQYRFFVPHDVNGMMQLFGGQPQFTADLDSIFTVTQQVDGDLVDITGLIGQYVHGNEPSHHIAYLYNYVGQPWKTQQMTRRLLDEMYAPTPEGIIGNEDCGQMSAWYILSALGFYSVCPGTGEFALTPQEHLHRQGGTERQGHRRQLHHLRPTDGGRRPALHPDQSAQHPAWHVRRGSPVLLHERGYRLHPLRGQGPEPLLGQGERNAGHDHSRSANPLHPGWHRADGSLARLQPAHRADPHHAAEGQRLQGRIPPQPHALHRSHQGGTETGPVRATHKERYVLPVL